MENLIVILIRLIVPLSIFRWPLAGALASLVADNLDVVLASLIDLGGLWNYHHLDKYLDTYYLGIAAIVALRWEPLPRRISLFLFAYRLTGVALFQITGVRLFLFIFPGLFESFFIFYAALKQFAPGYILTGRRLALWLPLLFIPKLGQEYVIHSARLLDDVVAVEVIADVTAAVLDGLSRFFGLLAP
ncbi:MAG: hypothetical protein ACE5KW_01350 [Dehalococcoidia bacterium]